MLGRCFRSVCSCWVATVFARKFRRPTKRWRKSIAVLPFGNLSRDPDNEYFAAGIQDEIITRLAQISDLKVISCSSTQRYKGRAENLRQIASELGVTNILEGSVQKANDEVHVNVQLLNALTDSHLWADTFDRKLTDVFGVESEIAKTIADTLRAKLTGREAATLSARPTENSAAHELYLKGRFFWNKRDATDLEKALVYFQQAAKEDPNYALAWSGIADVYVCCLFLAAPIRLMHIRKQRKRLTRRSRSTRIWRSRTQLSGNRQCI